MRICPINRIRKDGRIELILAGATMDRQDAIELIQDLNEVFNLGIEFMKEPG